MDSDGVYFARRAAEERVAAMKTAHPIARKTHLELASRYDELARAIDATARDSGLQQREESQTG
jgi:hypothetical protein